MSSVYKVLFRVLGDRVFFRDKVPALPMGPRYASLSLNIYFLKV